MLLNNSVCQVSIIDCLFMAHIQSGIKFAEQKGNMFTYRAYQKRGPYDLPKYQQNFNYIYVAYSVVTRWRQTATEP